MCTAIYYLSKCVTVGTVLFVTFLDDMKMAVLSIIFPWGVLVQFLVLRVAGMSLQDAGERTNPAMDGE